MFERMSEAALKELLKDKQSNPYKFFENVKYPDRKNAIRQFISNKGLPQSWDDKEIKLAWAFQGLLQVSLETLIAPGNFALYFDNLYFGQSDVTLAEAYQKRKEKDACFTRHMTSYDLAPNGHYAFTILSNMYNPNPSRQQALLIEKGTVINGQLMVALSDALEVAGNMESSLFRMTFKAQSDGTLFDTLRLAFQVPDEEYYYLERTDLIQVFSNEGALIPAAEQWLDLWVQDNDLKEHLSCFMEQKRGLRDRRDIYLHAHCNPKWKVGTQFPGTYTENLQNIMKLSCMLGWAWEHVDMIESQTVVFQGKNVS